MDARGPRSLSEEAFLSSSPHSSPPPCPWGGRDLPWGPAFQKSVPGWLPYLAVGGAGTPGTPRPSPGPHRGRRRPALSRQRFKRARAPGGRGLRAGWAVPSRALFSPVSPGRGCRDSSRRAAGTRGTGPLCCCVRAEREQPQVPRWQEGGREGTSQDRASGAWGGVGVSAGAEGGLALEAPAWPGGCWYGRGWGTALGPGGGLRRGGLVSSHLCSATACLQGRGRLVVTEGKASRIFWELCER